MKAEHTAPHIFRFDIGRLARNLTGLLPILGFPLALHLMNRSDPLLDGIFGVVAAALVGGLVYSARRYKVVLTGDTLDCRGRLRHRKIRLTEILGLEVRPGRGKPTRFMGPPPFHEMVLHTAKRRLVISSLPLGEPAFQELVNLLSARLPNPVSVD